MQAIGVDMSKDSFHACFEAGVVEVFANTFRGIKKFIRTVERLGHERAHTRIGVEATGAYHLLFAETLRVDGWTVVVINPLLAARFGRMNLRGVKTDRVDAGTIRAAVLADHGYPYTDTPDILKLKTLVQQRMGLKRMHAECQQRHHAHTYKERASSLPIPDHFQGVQALLLKEIKTVDRQIASVASETQTLLRSIPGIGTLSAASLVAYVGDINRFSSPEKLVAYLGLDCRIRESGTSIHGKGHLTKRGNKQLRAVLFNAAFIAQRYNPDLKAFFEKKLAEGKHHFVALCAVERKLVHLVYAVWKRGTPYEKRCSVT